MVEVHQGAGLVSGMSQAASEDHPADKQPMKPIESIDIDIY